MEQRPAVFVHVWKDVFKLIDSNKDVYGMVTVFMRKTAIIILVMCYMR